MVTREQDLIRQVQEGKSGAYARLVRKHRRPLYHSVFKMLGDADAAADVTQQAFVSVYENIHLYNPDHRFFSWLFRIAYNGAINRIRRRRCLCPLGDIEPASNGPAPDAQVQAAETAAYINDALAHLSYKYRVVLVLRHYLDFSYAEIARITELPATTVRSRLHTARVLLRDELHEQGLVDGD